MKRNLFFFSFFVFFVFFVFRSRGTEGERWRNETELKWSKTARHYPTALCPTHPSKHPGAITIESMVVWWIRGQLQWHCIVESSSTRFTVKSATDWTHQPDKQLWPQTVRLEYSTIMLQKLILQCIHRYLSVFTHAHLCVGVFLDAYLCGSSPYLFAETRCSVFERVLLPY